MIETIKFKTSSQNVFFLGCLHFGHDKEFLWKKRGYSSVIEHDIDLLKRWNKKVQKGDVVFLLGDTLFGQSGEERLKDLIKELNGSQFYLMPGNHTAGWRQLYKSCFIYDVGSVDIFGRVKMQIDDKLVYFIPNYFEIYVDGHPIVLSHYPIRCWNSYAKGSWMLHSHVHGSLESSLSTHKQGKILDCGVESIKEPLSFSEIKKIMDYKLTVVEDHHSDSTPNPF